MNHQKESLLRTLYDGAPVVDSRGIIRPPDIPEAKPDPLGKVVATCSIREQFLPAVMEFVKKRHPDFIAKDPQDLFSAWVAIHLYEDGARA